ncbi:Histone-lysine N-methyltransferase SETMAR, partial [Melipona quadrifasciata]
REHVEMLKISKTTVHKHLVKLDYTNRYDEFNRYSGKTSELANRKNLVFHQDNARSHVSLTIRQKLVLLHLPYSPDIAPSNFHLF